MFIRLKQHLYIKKDISGLVYKQESHLINI